MYFGEHKFLGDTTPIPGVNGEEQKKQFTLRNGLVVTYGDMNAFAGDYFGHERPITADKNDFEKMKLNFQRWHDLIALPPKAKDKAEAVRAALKPLNDQVEQILHADDAAGDAAERLASVYQKSPLNIWELNKITNDEKWAPNGANFNTLLATNADHFAEEARITYDAGHALALDHAAKGDLDRALTVNACADHFLEDSFAAGHLRVPRAQLMEAGKAAGYLAQVINASANVMHEEDGALGVWVRSPSGEVWKAFGDGRLPGVDRSDKATSTNLRQCRKALDVSVAEILSAYETKTAIKRSDFKAWHHAPILEDIASDPDNHLPLVQVEGVAIKVRVGGPGSKQYTGISGLADWIQFYTENLKYIEGQVKLTIKNFLGISL